MKEAFPPRMWDWKTRTLQPARLHLHKFGALHVEFKRKECVLILGLLFMRKGRHPWCQIVKPLPLHSISSLARELEGLQIDADNSTKKKREILLELQFSRFSIDETEIGKILEARKHRYVFEDLILFSVVEGKTVLGRETFIVHFVGMSTQIL